MNPKHIAALAAKSILADVLELESRCWICGFCGNKTTILSEICSKCKREDCSQGSGLIRQYLKHLRIV